MRQSLRPGLAVVLLWCALGAQASAKSRSEPSAAPECDMMCEVGAYLSRDHMVAAVPAADAAVPAGPPARPARKAVKPNPPKVAAEADAPKARGASPARRSAVPLPVAPPRRREALARSEAPVRRAAARTASLALPVTEAPAPNAEAQPRPLPRHELRREVVAPSQVAAPAVIPGSAPLVTSQFESPSAH